MTEVNYNPKMFIEKLETLNYFRYCDKSNIEQVRQEIFNSFSKYRILSTPKDEFHIPLDFRLYFCDMEVLCEHLGYEKMIEQIKPTLEKLNAYNEVIAKVPKSSNTEINVDSVFIFIKSMNNLLELKGIDEKWYLIYGGNDGQMILLTRELFEILNNEINDPKSKPMKVEDWLKIATYGTLSEPELIDTAIEPKVGDRINHRSLGLGIIQLISDRGVATINFELHGQRNVILQYAKFEIL